MQSFTIQLSGDRGGSFACTDDDTILRAALRSGIGLPYECNSGRCGLCQFELVDGEIRELWPEAPGLSPRARERGRRLACQSAPLSACTIKASASNDNAPILAPERRTVTLRDVTPLTPDMAEFTFISDGIANFRPGQFAMLSLPNVTGPRAYSMSNLPNEAGEWRFIIKRVPDGLGTAVLFDGLQPGMTVSLDAPFGNSYLRASNGRDIVCVAGGSGLSPVLSILAAAVRAPEMSGRDLYLFYGGRGPQDICVQQIVAADPLLSERVSLHTAISDVDAPGADRWEGERGLIHELVERTLGELITSFDFYFCGPPPMTDALQRMLMFEHKVPTNQLFFDRFF